MRCCSIRAGATVVSDRTWSSLVKLFFELPHALQVEEDSDVYGSLDPSLTLLMHGVETDWIEEEMADDDDFRSPLHVPKNADVEDFSSYSQLPKSFRNKAK
jgi:hypothetical protein